MQPRPKVRSRSDERARDVAALVAEGRTNRQFGATMSLSETTIEYYLTRIYGKLGIRTRAELAAAVGGEIHAAAPR